MSKDLAIFEFGGAPVRIVHIDDQPWWVATDLAAVLGYEHVPHMLRMLDDDQKGVHKVDTLGGTQEATIVNESGMWTCVIRSKREEAKAFQRLLTGEILPALRRDGFYALPGVKISRPASVAQFSSVVGELKRERSPQARALLWQRMDQISDSWGVSRCERAIGFADPDYSDVLGKFWAEIDALDEAGITLNRSRRNHLIALNMPEVRACFIEVGVPIEVDSRLMQALRHSASPAFVADKSANCADGKVRHCWIFTHAPLAEVEKLAD